MKTYFRGAVAAIAVTAAVMTSNVVQAADTIKVGILHSLSGTMAISETTLKDVMLMLIDEQNKKGGLLGKKLEPVVVDPASNWPLSRSWRSSWIDLEAASCCEMPMVTWAGVRVRVGVGQRVRGRGRVKGRGRG